MKSKQTTEPESWKRFLALTKQVLSVPKKELDRRAAEYEREKKQRQRKKAKPSR